MPLGESSRPNKIFCYTPYQLTDATPPPYGNTISNLTTPSDSLQVIILSSHDPRTDHIIMREKHGCAKEKIGYCSGRHEVIICDNANGHDVIMVMT